ncbi:hypothetical protein, partial [Rhodovulum viride]|uniref:hypothetical protein n=1 Tax=Rhodovulum viride TaxID=1231134 RepID=UPI001C6560B5
AMAVAAPASAATVPVWHADDLQVVTLADGRSAFRPVGLDEPFTAKWALPREAAICPQQALGKEWALCRIRQAVAVLDVWPSLGTFFVWSSVWRSPGYLPGPSPLAGCCGRPSCGTLCRLTVPHPTAPVPQPTGPEVVPVPAPSAAVLIATAFLGLRAFRKATAQGRGRYARPIPFPFRRSAHGTSGRGAQVPPDRFQCAPRVYPPLSSSLVAGLPGEARAKTRGRDFREAA